MEEQKRNFFEEATEVVGWIEIFLSPFIASCILAGIVYIYFDSIFALIVADLIIIIGIFIAIKFATKIYKSEKGTVHFVSRIIASPELDEEKKEDKK